MSALNDKAQDVRVLAQERIVDALLRALALEQPGLLERVRSILVDTEFTHVGKPAVYSTVHEQIQSRLNAAVTFTNDHGAE